MNCPHLKPLSDDCRLCDEEARAAMTTPTAGGDQALRALHKKLAGFDLAALPGAVGPLISHLVLTGNDGRVYTVTASAKGAITARWGSMIAASADGEDAVGTIACYFAGQKKAAHG